MFCGGFSPLELSDCRVGPLPTRTGRILVGCVGKVSDTKGVVFFPRWVCYIELRKEGYGMISVLACETLEESVVSSTMADIDILLSVIHCISVFV